MISAPMQRTLRGGGAIETLIANTTVSKHRGSQSTPAKRVV
jgi:hypothetical protein